MAPTVARLSPLLFLSGAAALVLEVAWFRRLAQLAGGTSVALGAVIAAVIGGMAIGAWLLGRRADRTDRPVRLYAILELLVAAAALLSPWLLDLSRGGFTWLQHALGDHRALHAGATFLFASLMLAPPSIAMGGTLPAMASALAGGGRPIGFLYAANTLGAVAGTLLAGFLLLPRLGLAGTMRAAALLSAVAAAGAMLLRAPRPPQTSAPRGPSPEARRAILLYAISGFLGLAAEVCFTRSLVLVFGSATYAFSVMLSVLLLGIGWGGAWGARTTRDPLRTLEVTVAATAAVLSLSMLLVPLLPRLFLLGYLHGGEGFATGILLRFAIAACVMLPGAFGLGFAFPLAAGLACTGTVGAGTGRLYAWNTVASVAGSTTAVFLLVPALGPEGALALVASGVGIALFALARRPTVLALALVACCGWIPAPEVARERLLAGIYFNPGAFLTDGRIDERSWREGVDIAWSRTGRDMTVSVWRWYGRHSLLVDGKAEASDQVLADDHHLALLGHLPMLAHEDPRRVLVVGLGMGTTLRAVEQHAPETLRVIEIEPAVVEAARWLGREPPQVILADARTWLRATDERFDVITSDPIHPSVRGSGDLYTLEYWQSCRDRLAPGGLVCHWLPVYQMGVDDLRAVLATFSRVFRTAVYFGGGDLVLLGAPDGLPGPPRPLENPVAGLERDLSKLRVAQLAAPSAGTLLTEDRLHLEFSTPRQVHQPELAACFEWVRELWGSPPEPYGLALEMEIAWARGGGDALGDAVRRALAEHPEHPFVQRFAGELFLDWAGSSSRAGDIATAEGMLRRARVYLGEDSRIAGTEGDLLAAKGDRAGAAARFRELIGRYGESRYLRRRIAALEGR